MAMPPRSRGSMRTWRSDRISVPEWPASPVRVSVATVMTSPFLFAADFGEFSVCFGHARLLSQLCQNRVGHLHRASRTLTDRFGAPGYAHHVVGTDFAFLYHGCDGGADTTGFLHLAYMLEHHDRGEEHRDRVHDGQVEFRILGRGTMRWLEDRNLVPDVAGRREAQTADQPGEGVGDHVAEQVRRDHHSIVLGILGQPHGLRVDVGGPQRDARVVLRDRPGFILHHAGGLAQHVWLLADGHGLVAI